LHTGPLCNDCVDGYYIDDDTGACRGMCWRCRSIRAGQCCGQRPRCAAAPHAYSLSRHHTLSFTEKATEGYCDRFDEGATYNELTGACDCTSFEYFFERCDRRECSFHLNSNLIFVTPHLNKIVMAPLLKSNSLPTVSAWLPCCRRLCGS
jgi:hypothetical protein